MIFKLICQTPKNILQVGTSSINYIMLKFEKECFTKKAIEFFSKFFNKKYKDTNYLYTQKENNNTISIHMDMKVPDNNLMNSIENDIETIILNAHKDTTIKKIKFESPRLCRSKVIDHNTGLPKELKSFRKFLDAFNKKNKLNMKIYFEVLENNLCNQQLYLLINIMHCRKSDNVEYKGVYTLELS